MSEKNHNQENNNQITEIIDNPQESSTVTEKKEPKLQEIPTITEKPQQPPQQSPQQVPQVPQFVPIDVIKKKRKTTQNMTAHAKHMRTVRQQKMKQKNLQENLRAYLPPLIVVLSLGAYVLSVKTGVLDGLTDTLKKTFQSKEIQEIVFQPIKIVEKVIEKITVRDTETETIPDPEIESQTTEIMEVPVEPTGYVAPQLDFFS